MKALNEDGQLSARLDEFRMQSTSTTPASRMHGVRRRPLRRVLACSGTKRGRIMFGKAMKCAMRNENGLMACPSSATPTSSSAR